MRDEARDAVVEKAKAILARYNGTFTEVEEWGKKKLAYEIQKMHEGFYYFIQFEADATVLRQKSKDMSASWTSIKIPSVERGIIFAGIFESTIKNRSVSKEIKR